MRNAQLPIHLLAALCCSSPAATLFAQDFTISASPTSLGTLLPGAKTKTTITVAVSGGFDAQMVLTAPQLPYGTVKLTPAVFPKPGSGASEMTIELAAPSPTGQIAPGNYTVYVTATGAKQAHSATVNFSVPGVGYLIGGTLGPILSGSDPLHLKGNSFTAQTGLSPYNQPTPPPNPLVSTPAGLWLTAGNPEGPVALSCTGATVTLTQANSAAHGTDTLQVANCTLAGLAPFTMNLAMPPRTFPSTLPFSFGSANLLFSTVSYTIQGQTTVLHVKGNVSAEFISGRGDHTYFMANPPTLVFTAAAGGAPASQSLTIDTKGNQTGYFVLPYTGSGGKWLSLTPDYAQTGGSVSVTVDPSALSPGTYYGELHAYGAAKNSPRRVEVMFTVTP